MKALLIAIPLVPLAAAVACWSLSPSSRLAGIVATAASLLALAMLAIIPGELRASVTWMSVGGLDAGLGLRSDGLARTIALFVAAISAAVDVYAIAYMADDRRRGRFFAWMAAFAGAMLALVLADSLLLLFVAWELVGVVSFALIAFHHRDGRARRAARRAFLVTRSGDLAFLLALVLVWITLGTTDLDAMSSAAVDGRLDGVALQVVAFGLLIAAVAKSAQLPLSSWLPAAMVAPTPVSALLHSATMVAAGIFLVARTWPVFDAVASAQLSLAWVGATTALASALIATGARDLKRLLAWSTISQLGVMMMVLGLASPAAAVFHLVIHGVIKAALFAIAGSIDQRSGARKLDELGGLLGRAPWLAAAFAVAGLALAGVPPLSGFYSGEAMLGAAADAHPMWAAVVCVDLFLAGVYVSRAFGAAFLRWPKAPCPAVKPARRPALLGIVPLALGAATAGFVLRAPLEAKLPFASTVAPGHIFRVVAIAAGVLGVGIGIGRVLRRGPVPALGVGFHALEGATEAAIAAPARVAAALAAATSSIEAALDALVRQVSRASAATARITAATDADLDAIAGRIAHAAAAASRVVAATDTELDDAARASGRRTAQLAVAIERAERDGLGAGVDRAASQLGSTGDALRRLHTGQIHHYAMSLFLWTLVAGVVAALIWI